MMHYHNIMCSLFFMASFQLIHLLFSPPLSIRFVKWVWGIKAFLVDVRSLECILQNSKSFVHYSIFNPMKSTRFYAISIINKCAIDYNQLHQHSPPYTKSQHSKAQHESITSVYCIRGFSCSRIQPKPLQVLNLTLLRQIQV